MTRQGWNKGYAIYSIVFLIGLLLIGNIYLIYKNSQVIEYNKALYEKAEKIQVNTVEIIRNLHLLDMSLRSYALVKQRKYIVVADSCIKSKNIIFKGLELGLSEQHYPMEKFYAMRDSVNEYYKIIARKREALVNGRFDDFVRLLEPDPGYYAWEAYAPFSDSVKIFETEISQNAQAEYERALRNSYLLQVALFLLAMPTLAYTAYYTTRTLNLSEQLRNSNEKNYQIVTEQNVRLEEMVKDRTKEILLRNEEIAAHNKQLVIQQHEIESHRNELKDQNQQLQEAKKTIEQQNKQIQIRHDALAVEVDRQTQDLKKTNLELIEHNSSLEQFAFIISHNLRAPMARLVGLSTVLEHARNGQESKAIIQMMIKSTGELDQVFKDLGLILGIKKPGTFVAQVNLYTAIEKVVSMLGFEMKETGAKLIKNFEVETLCSLPPYIESILFNLLSNAIKYRHPKRPPVISIHSKVDNGHIRIDVSDNGLGIDLATNKDRIFSLYQRFHSHVEGKGLGLYLVKTQVAALGGRIEVQSKIDQGTSFTLFLKNI